jgi:hypothetical protein
MSVISQPADRVFEPALEIELGTPPELRAGLGVVAPPPRRQAPARLVERQRRHLLPFDDIEAMTAFED